MTINPRFTFTVPASLLEELRKASFNQNLSISRYIVEAVMWRMEWEKKNGRS